MVRTGAPIPIGGFVEPGSRLLDSSEGSAKRAS
jgi:hypothetical protein